jgi:hypothetical protein
VFIRSNPNSDKCIKALLGGKFRATGTSIRRHWRSIASPTIFVPQQLLALARPRAGLPPPTGSSSTRPRKRRVTLPLPAIGSVPASPGTATHTTREALQGR